MRVFSAGPCLGSGDAQSNSFANDFAPRNSKDFTEGGFAIRGLTNRSMQVRFSEGTSLALTTLTNKMYARFWIRMKRYPQFVTGDVPLGECPITATQSSLQGGVNTILTVNAAGQVKFINTGNQTSANYDHLWTSSTKLTIGQWYKIEWYLLNERFNGPPGVPLGETRIRISDIFGNLLEDSGIVMGGTDNEGFNVNQNIYELAWGRRVGSTNNGCEFDLSHLAIDIDHFPEDSRCTLVPVVAKGTYQQFDLGNLDHQARNMIGTSGISVLTDFANFTGNAGAGGRYITYRVKSLADCGVTGPIYGLRVALFISALGTAANARAVLIVNGVIHLSPSNQLLNQTIWNNMRFDVTVSPTDTLEIGLVTFQTGSTTRFGGAWVIVDHDSPVTDIQTSDFQIGIVEWVGTGGPGQTIQLPFVPNLVFAWPKSPQPDPWSGGFQPGSIWWDTLWSFHDQTSIGPRRDAIKLLVDKLTNSAVLNIFGDYDYCNSLNIEYWALLIRDPTNRIHARGYVTQNSQTTPYDTDNINYSLSEGTATPGVSAAFPPEAMLLYKETDNTSSAAYMRGPAQVGDATMVFNGSTPVTDVIQAFLSNGFQLGKTAYGTADRSAFVAMRRDVFANQRLFNIVTWKGNGTVPGSDTEAELPRLISVDLGGKAPEAMLIFPDSTGDRCFWHAKMFGSQLTSFELTTVDSDFALDGTVDGAGVILATNIGSNGRKRIREARFALKKVGSPTGQMRVKIYRTSGGSPANGTGPIAISDPVDAASLGSSYDWAVFSFSGLDRFPLVRGTTYFGCLEYSGTLTDYVAMAQDASGIGAQAHSLLAGVFTSLGSAKLAFRYVVDASSRWAQGGFDQDGIQGYENDGFWVGPKFNSGVSVGNYSFGNQTAGEALDGDPTATAQTFTCSADGVLGRVVFMMRKTGIPTGNCVAKLYATAAGVPTGAALATSEEIAVADFSNEFFNGVAFQFLGANKIALVNGTVYAVSLEYVGSGTDYIEVGDDRTGPVHAGTKYNRDTLGAWNAVVGQDLCFNVTVDGALTWTALVWSVGLDALGLPPTGIWHEFLVCGHACKEIESWYVGGIRQPTSSAEGDPDTEAYFLIPGYSAYENAFGTLVKTRTYNGRVYTCIYLKEGGNSPLDIRAILGEVTRSEEGEFVEGGGTPTPLTINVKGIETVGDGSGTLIEDSFAIYKHLMQNWVFGNYQAGAWLTTPVYPDSDNVPMMLDQSFTDAAAVAARRLEGGYKGAGALGFQGTISVRDLIRTMNLSCDCDSGLNRKCQFFVSMVDDSAVVALFSPELTDIEDILKSSLDIEDDFQNHFNAIPYKYKRDFVEGTNTEWRAESLLSDATSIASYADTITMETQELLFVRDEATAKDIIRRKLLRHKDPPRLVRWSTAAKGFNIDLGDTRLLTHFGGIGDTGYVRQPVRVQRHIAHPQHNKVDFEGYDMSRLFATVFILGDETVLQPSWALAVGPDADDRIYGYLADETTGKFSDGEDGKRVR